MITEQEHFDHSRKIALRCAEALHCHWPTLHLDGFDVEAATDLMEKYIPICQVEAEIDAARIMQVIVPARPEVKGVGVRLRAVLGMGESSLFEALKFATEVLELIDPSVIEAAKVKLQESARAS